MYISILKFMLVIFGLYLIVQGIRCHKAVNKRFTELATYEARTIKLEYGTMTYIDKGSGEPILSVHGIFGGYDQAYDTCKDLSPDYRIIAPSRFGYLGSDVYSDGTPKAQAAAYVELLDKLGIEKVFLLATSAGGSVAIRFALDYPERTKGLILYCSAMPSANKPEKYAEYAGPPAFLCNNYMMFLISPLFKLVMGMEPSTIYGMLPIKNRKEGVLLDSKITNPDMARNYHTYNIEELKISTLILHAKDDKLAKYSDVERVLYRFPDYNFVSFESGGHLMSGHEEEVRQAVNEYIDANK